MNPYRLAVPSCINFSGGRSSAYMLYHILDAYDGVLPEEVAVVFANTGLERAETYEFIREVERRWSVPIAWLEFVDDESASGGREDPKRRYDVTCFETASRSGEPFRAMVRAAKALPSPVRRSCTHELKVQVVRKYLLDRYGWRRARRVLGIRHDEPRRWKKALYTSCDVEYPMVPARVSKEDVLRFWSAQPFDLGIPSEQGNCTLCFLKGKQNLLDTIRERPALANWWIETEEEHLAYKRRQGTLRDMTQAQFHSRYTYRSLREQALANVSDDRYDEVEPDCFCTD